MEPVPADRRGEAVRRDTGSPTERTDERPEVPERPDREFAPYVYCRCVCQASFAARRRAAGSRIFASSRFRFAGRRAARRLLSACSERVLLRDRPRGGHCGRRMGCAARAPAHESVVGLSFRPAVLPCSSSRVQGRRRPWHFVRDRRRIAAILKRVEHHVEGGSAFVNPTPSPAKDLRPGPGLITRAQAGASGPRACTTETGSDAGEPDVQSRLA